jgi:cysteine-rich repeat protein
MMTSNSFIRALVLACILWSSACDGVTTPTESSGDTPNETEINLVISDPATTAQELAMVIDFVSYQINCPDSGATPGYDDSVAISGVFEAAVDESPGVWNVVSDLPLSNCMIALWVYYEDEVICSGSQPMTIVPDDDVAAPNEVNIALECSLSVIPPSGDLEIDGSFNLVHGNYCPQLFWLGAFPTPGDPLGFTVQTSYTDTDNGCGQNCDPQTCDFTQNPPVCNPAPDPGLSSTLSAPAGNGSFGDKLATETNYACNPLLPGPTEICVLVSDGDNDCDQMRCITIDCPDLCEGVDCTDVDQNGLPIECTWDRCNPLDGTCSNTPAPDGIACNDCNDTCQSGVCDPSVPFTAAVNGSAMTFQGSIQQVDTTLVNPYSGESLTLSGPFNVNISSYKGIGASDVLTGTNLGDLLLVQDPAGSQRICGVETIRSQNSFDAMIMADGFITLADMIIEGGNAPDVLWANAGDDTLLGNNGVDRIDGGPGDDTIEGGNGDDTITLWPGSGFDSIDGGVNIDTVEINAIQSQITITQAANPSYTFDISYLGTPMAQIREVELVVLDDASIDLATCTGSPGDLCNLCGNDALNGGESCDDGNNASGDGCAADCTAEY